MANTPTISSTEGGTRLSTTAPMAEYSTFDGDSTKNAATIRQAS